MNTLGHMIINFVLGVALQLNRLEILFFVLGAVIIDFDHPVYMMFAEKIYSPKKMWAWHKRENAICAPHPFFLHLIEIPLALCLAGYFVNLLMFWFFAGMVVHWIVDMIVHRIYHGNFSSLKSYSLIGYLFF